MNPDGVFQAANATAAVGWLALIASRWVPRLRPWVRAGTIPLLLAAAYVAVLTAILPGASGGFDSLAGVQALFGNPWMVVAGWLHYLAFDLLVGTWIWEDSSRRGIPAAAVLLPLAATFFFGPAGFLLYILLRSGWARPRFPGFP